MRSALRFFCRPTGLLLWACYLAILAVTFPSSAFSQIVISEFMASNSRTLEDEDHSFPDWIELQNISTQTVDLAHWTLSDSPQTAPEKRWTFPSTNLSPNGFLLVFASGKNRRVPGLPLHTDFQLNRGGDSIILRDPQATISDTTFVRPFPPQVADISYGLGREFVDIPLITSKSAGQCVVPTSALWDQDWMSPLFLPAGWRSGTGAWGYDTRAAGSLPVLPNPRQDLRDVLLNKNTTAYLRIPFTTSDPAAIDSLTLTVSYADGFVAFINGTEVASDNRPPVLAWNSLASERRDWLSDGLPRAFELSHEALSTLRIGTNWLTLQGLSASNNSQAFILGASLTGAHATSSSNSLRYFTTPTPGSVNGFGTRQLGPILSDLLKPPADLSPNQPIQVSVRAGPSFNPVKRVELRYRVMFSNEISMPMLDDGKHHDGRPRDGIYGATIPANLLRPGEIMRWYCIAEDTAGVVSRWPPFEDPKRSPAYWGTMARTNDSEALPDFHWFVDEPNIKAASTLIGTRCSVFSRGELYDNVEVRIRGQLSLGWGQHNYKFDFNPGHLFLYSPGEPRVEEVNLNSAWSDKSYSRTVLAWESYREGGTPDCRAFPMRVYQNGRFFSVATFVEQPDARWLSRNGLDPTGSLYKMNSALESTAGTQKKLPRDGDLRELDELIQSIASTNPRRTEELFDRWDLPSLINYLAITTLIHDNDCVAKNYFLFHDRNHSGLWHMLPWDKDLTFGHNYQSHGGLSDDIWADIDRPGDIGLDHPLASPSHPLFGDRTHQKENGQWNRLIDLIHELEPTRQMYLRRLRTLMDLLLQSPETPRDELRYEQRLDALMHAMRDDAALDRIVSGAPGYGSPQSLSTALRLLETSYLVKRRVHLYTRHSETNASRVANSAKIPQLTSPGTATLRWGRIERSPVSGNAEEEFMEILNPSPVAWDISGGAVRGLISYTMPPGTVIPPSFSLFLCRNASAFRHRSQSPHGGQGLFIQGDYTGSLGSKGGTIELVMGTTVIAQMNLDDQLSQAQRFLRIQRIQYHPNEEQLSNAELEYLELSNRGTEPLDLDGIRFTEGVRFAFSTGAVHRIPAPVDSSDPQRSVLLVRNMQTFTSRYGADPRIAGQYEGHLGNHQELLRLEDARGQVIQEFRYSPAGLPLTEGVGFPLIHDPDAPLETWSDSTTWRMGIWEGDSKSLPPWQATPVPSVPVRIRDLLLGKSGESPDVITLDAPADVDIGAWFLSDSLQHPRKFQIPTNTRIQANLPIRISSGQFSDMAGPWPGFRLNLDGGDVYLFSGDAKGQLTGYYHRARYGRGLPGSAFVRQEAQRIDDFWMRAADGNSSISPGINVPSSLTLTEIHYHPPDPAPGVHALEEEYVEIHNPTPSPILLFNPSTPGLSWRMQGAVRLELPRVGSIPSGGYLLAVAFDPLRDTVSLDHFRKRYGIPVTVPIIGPWLGSLPRSQGELILEAPVFDQGTARWVEMDRVVYSDSFPWPSEADGMGASLSRRNESAPGIISTQWAATAPSPGEPFDDLEHPSILISPNDRVASAYSEVLLGVLAGFGNRLQYQWRHNGVPIRNATQSTLLLQKAELLQSGTYDALVMGRGGIAWSDAGRLTVIQPPTLYDLPSLPLAVAGTNYFITVGAVGSGSLKYQWKKEGIPLVNQTNSSLLLTTVSSETDGNYSVRVMDTIGEIESPSTPIHVVYSPQLLWPPESQMINVGEAIRLRVILSGTPPFAYLWRKDGLNLKRPSQNTLTIPNAQLTNAGVYSLLVSNIATTRFVAIPQKANVLVLGDSDGDGMPDIWELTYQLRFDDPSDAAIDSDLDGMTNLEEYRAGTNPRDASDYVRLDLTLDLTPRFQPSGATLRFMTISNRTYSIQASDRLDGSWSSWMDLPAQQTNKPFAIPIDVRHGVPQLHYRLHIP